MEEHSTGKQLNAKVATLFSEQRKGTDASSYTSTFSGDANKAQQRKPAKKEKKQHSLLRTIIELALVLVIALGLTWVIKTFFAEPFEVPTGSMENTIMSDDKLLADKFTVNFQSVERGDIIVFADIVMPGRILVKRAIATGGEVVDIKNGLVYVDDKPLYEPYTEGAETLPFEQTFENMNITYPYTVPEGHIWVMGDNRGNSADSRYFGTVTEDSVYGRALFVFWPLENIGPL